MKVLGNTPATVPGLNKSRGIVGALHRDYYYLRLTSVQFSSVNIINGMKRMGAARPLMMTG